MAVKQALDHGVTETPNRDEPQLGAARFWNALSSRLLVMRDILHQTTCWDVSHDDSWPPLAIRSDESTAASGRGCVDSAGIAIARR